jgi:hypothetical protein
MSVGTICWLSAVKYAAAQADQDRQLLPALPDVIMVVVIVKAIIKERRPSRWFICASCRAETVIMFSTRDTIPVLPGT